MTASQPARHLRFGPFEIDLRAGELCKDGVRVLLPEQPFQILCALVDQPGELVTREEIRDRLWANDTVVEFDHSINAAVRRLRELLGDDADQPVYIETIPRRGYRFIAAVHATPASSHSPSGPLNGGAAGDREEIRTIAVLPFENVSGDPDSEYLSDGITETLIDGLSQLGRLRVLARRTVFRFKGQAADALGLGRKLNVRAVLTGRVLRRGDTLMICAELIDAVNGWQLWGERYKRRLTDIFDVQEEISRAIFDKLRVKLGREDEQQLARRHTQNTRAYEAYLKGLFFWNQWSSEGFRKAEEFFRQAITEDPSYAPAYAGLADSLSAPRYLGLVSPRETIPKVRAAVEKALALDDSLPLAWYVDGINKLLYEWNWKAAEEAFHRAVEAGPHDPRGYVGLGYTFAVQASLEEGIREMTQATKLDPLSPVWTYGTAMIYYWMRREDEAREELAKSLEIDQKFLLSRLLLGQVDLFSGRLEDAIREFRRAARDSGDHPYALGYLAYTFAASGQRTEAENLIVRLGNPPAQRYLPPLALALAHLGAGEFGMAFDWLNRAADEREPRMTHLKVDPFFEPLRPDSCFRNLLGRVGLRQQ